MARKIFILFFAGIFLYACATVPISGRRQLNLVSNSEILPLSYDQYQKVIRESKLSNNQQWVNMVRTVGNRTKNAVEQYMRDKGQEESLRGYQWEFNLIEEDVINAWAMPGGKIAFYTGIMPICRDETGVAVVMGHEIAHAVANHARERFSQAMATELGLNSISAALGQSPSTTQQILLQAAGLSSQLGMLKFSRTHESEADQMGLIFMAMAGYNPQEAPRFWERMEAESSGARPPEFLSTHPNPGTRIADLNKHMSEAMKYYNR